MKSKIRNMVIRISYSKYLELIMFLILVGLIISVFVLRFLNLECLSPVIIAFSIIALLGVCIRECFVAIRRKRREIVERNKLTNIILSDEDVWLYPLLWIMLIIGNMILFVLNIEISFISTIIFIIVMSILTISLSLVLSKFFKKKLIE